MKTQNNFSLKQSSILPHIELYEGAYSSLVKYITDDQNVISNCEKLEQGDKKELFDFLVKFCPDKLKGKEFLNYFIILSLLPPLKNDETKEASVQKIIQAIISSKAAEETKLTSFITLYNTTTSFSVLKSIFDFSLQTKQKVKMDKLFIEQFQNEEKKEIYRYLSQFPSSQSFEYLLKYIALNPKDEEFVKKAAHHSITASNIFEFNFSLNPTHPYYAAVELLKQKKFSNYKKLNLDGVNEEDFQNKLRLVNLTLYSGDVTYETIQKDLNIQDVESLIIQGKSKELVSVTLDETKKIIHFKTTKPENLLQNFETLKQNISKNIK